jgi:hypothetical protein
MRLSSSIGCGWLLSLAHRLAPIAYLQSCISTLAMFLADGSVTETSIDTSCMLLTSAAVVARGGGLCSKCSTTGSSPGAGSKFAGSLNICAVDVYLHKRGWLRLEQSARLQKMPPRVLARGLLATDCTDQRPTASLHGKGLRNARQTFAATCTKMRAPPTTRTITGSMKVCTCSAISAAERVG